MKTFSSIPLCTVTTIASFSDNNLVTKKWVVDQSYLSGTDYVKKDDPNQTGSIYASTFYAKSDYRIKTNVQPLLTETVNNLNPVKYFNTQSNKIDIGLIAHELQKEYPFLVTGEKDGKDIQTINYIGLIGILIKEIQELKKRVTDLESNI